MAAVVFTSLVGASSSGAGTITRTANTSGSYDSGGQSVATLAGDGSASVVATANNVDCVFGLSANDTVHGFTTIYGFYFASSTQVYVYEAGTQKSGPHTYAAGDTIKVAIESGVLKYYKNATLLYTSSVTPGPANIYPAHFDASVYKINDAFTNADLTLVTTLPLTDHFSGVDGTNLTAHTMDAGPGWQTVVGTFVLASNRASISVAPSACAIQASAGVSDVIASVIVNPGGSSSGTARGLWVRGLYRVGVVLGSNLFVIQAADGSTNLVTTAFTVTAGVDYTISCSCNGATLTATVNGANQIVYNSAANGTAHGLAGRRAGDVFDDFSVTAYGVAVALAGQVTATSSAAAALAITTPLAATSAAAASVAGALALTVPLGGAVSGSSAVTSAVSVTKPLTAIAAGASSAAGDVTLIKPFTAAITGVTSAGADVSLIVALTAAGVATSSAAGAISLTVPLAASVVGVSNLSAVLNLIVLLAAASRGQGAAIAVLTLASPNHYGHISVAAALLYNAAIGAAPRDGATITASVRDGAIVGAE